MSKVDGGPAFPVDERYETTVTSGSLTQIVTGVEQHLGISRLDYFAAHAVQGLLAKGGDWNPISDLANDAVQIAWQMLRAIEKLKEGEA